MNTEMLKREELTDAALDEVTGGAAGFLDYADAVLSAFVGHDREGRGPIHHFIDSGAHY